MSIESCQCTHHKSKYTKTGTPLPQLCVYLPVAAIYRKTIPHFYVAWYFYTVKHKLQVMQEEIKNSSSVNNSIFKYAFIGVLLCIATFGFTLTNFADIAMHEVPQMTIVTLMGLGSIALLSKAIKGDKERLREI